MPGGNRVEELEERVRELEATVDGLTDELIECKVRIRELENAVDGDIGLPGFEEEPPEEDPDEPETADTDKTEGSEGEDEESETDIIVA